MTLPRSFVPFALMAFAIAAQAGCKDDPPPPTPEPATSASAGAKSKLPTRSPSTPMPKVDPQAMKEYRVDVCYFGTLTLKQARDAYFASLGKDEPSEKKIPSFGAPATPAAAGSGAPGTSASPTAPKPGTAKTADAKAASPTAPGAKPASPTAPGVKVAQPSTAKPAVPGAPTPSAAPKTADASKTAPPAGGSSAKPASPLAGQEARPDMRRPFDISMRAPHDRNARGCTVAAGLKDFQMPGVDEALATFAPFSVELAKEINAASMYYQREEYKTDKFEKGKEFHKKLVEKFEKLDEHSDKLGAAIVEWRKAHPQDPAKLDEAQKLASAAWTDARELLLGVLPKKIDVAAYKERVAKLEKSIEALRTFGTANAADPWPKFLLPSLDAYLKTAKEAEPKVTEKGVQPDAFLNLITGYTSVIEANYRALSRSLIAKGQIQEPRVRNMIPPPASPTQAAPQAPEAPAEKPE